MKNIQQSLEHLRNTQALRTLAPQGELVDFASNDYLGFTTRPEIRKRLIEALEGGLEIGAGGSRLLGGNTEQHVHTESFLADAFGAESALLFSSGYQANCGILTTLGESQTEFFSDANNHASLIDGMRLSRASTSVFGHNNLDELERQLSQSKALRKIIVTETVFSMDGDLAPLEELRALAHRFGAWLVLDEAHATGLFGRRGRGCYDHYEHQNGVRSHVPVVTLHTASKALGGQGAFVLGPEIIKQYLINKCRNFIFSTAISPILSVQIEIAVSEMIRVADENWSSRVLGLAQYARQKLSPHFDLGRSASQIVPVILGSNAKALRVAAHLRTRGFEVKAIRAPTVPKGSERLRLSFNVSHTQEHVDALVYEILESGKLEGEKHET
jgi:8-amino-7-oxononanoate synthase